MANGALPSGYRPLAGSDHPHPADATVLRPTDAALPITVTIMLKRRADAAPRRPADFAAAAPPRPTPEDFAAGRGADPAALARVAAFARDAGLEVVSSDAARRSVIVRGPASAINQAFATQLHDYAYAGGTYRGHAGAVGLPDAIADDVAAVVGLTNRPVRATHFARKKNPDAADPPGTAPLTPAQVAGLYDFPPGDGAGQTIGLYEMETQGPDGSPAPAGYALSDIKATLKALGNLPMPRIVDVPIDGVKNSGRSDGETGLDITVAGAIAPAATLAVYFAGGQVQNMIHALQAMIHPAAGQPAPGVISISYGWGPDDTGTANFSEAEYGEFTQLFADAATNNITVLISSGDSGACIASQTQAQVSYPASDAWVTACGGTGIGAVKGASFEEVVWNDSGATGGGVSARFPVPAYQNAAPGATLAMARIPARNGTGAMGRGVPDIAGNASPYSGYLQVVGGGAPEPIGGTSAVAPLYAGLMARINANAGAAAGYLNAVLYGLPAATFRDIVSPPGPADNSYQGVTGYPAEDGWDACTGLGSLRGVAFAAALAAARAKPATAPAAVIA
jgi:kumamolisin